VLDDGTSGPLNFEQANQFTGLTIREAQELLEGELGDPFITWLVPAESDLE
jgi:hypothetical protein